MKVCPQCKRPYRDECTTCNKCGTILINYNEFMSSKNICPKCDKSYDKKYTICPTCGVPLISNDEWRRLKDPKSFQQQYQPHCPICGSPNVEKISATNKVGKGLLFGIFSIGTISKTYRCKNCGSKF